MIIRSSFSLLRVLAVIWLLAFSCVPSIGVENVKTIEELYTKNRNVEAEFHTLMASLRDEFGAELLERNGLKSEARVRCKLENIYNGDLNRVTDILAATLVFNTEEEIVSAAEVLKSRKYVVQFTNRWVNIQASG